jgi:hypothetical protein
MYQGGGGGHGWGGGGCGSGRWGGGGHGWGRGSGGYGRRLGRGGPGGGLFRLGHVQSRDACKNCGLFNHTTKECRKVFYEIYGYNNHSTYECKRCVLWNTGPELCATQVEEQSFFFIDECIDPKISKEKECIGVINII